MSAGTSRWKFANGEITITCHACELTFIYRDTDADGMAARDTWSIHANHGAESGETQ